MEKEIKSLSQILETSGLLSGLPTTAQPKPNSIEPEKRNRWLAKWIHLNAHHPQLQQALETIYDICSDYSKSPARGRTVVIYGENGCGKSHMARCIAYWARSIKTHIPGVMSRIGPGNLSTAECMLVNWAEVVDGFKPPASNYEIVEDLQDCALLIVDDIGAEHDPSKLGVEKLYVMLNRREFRWNIFTTNIPPAGWAEKFERRISSRLFRNAQHIDLTGVPDYSTI
jgi:DNA replication protein DnaC